MKKPFLLFMLLFPLFVFAQTEGESASAIGFQQGFHIGITGDVTASQSLKITPNPTFNSIVPTSKWLPAGKLGVELSYHFGKYFGVSAGVGYGCFAQFSKMTTFNSPLSNSSESNEYATSVYGIQVPVQLEFHYPLKKSNWTIYLAAGVNLSNLHNAAIHAAGYGNNLGEYRDVITNTTQDGIVFDEVMMQEYRDQIYFNSSDNPRVTIDLLMNAGAYYRLPNNDFLRFGFVANVALAERLSGTYSYKQIHNGQEETSIGNVSYRNNLLGVQVAYIHPFKTKSKGGF